MILYTLELSSVYLVLAPELQNHVLLELVV